MTTAVCGHGTIWASETWAVRINARQEACAVAGNRTLTSCTAPPKFQTGTAPDASSGRGTPLPPGCPLPLLLGFCMPRPPARSLLSLLLLLLSLPSAAAPEGLPWLLPTEAGEAGELVAEIAYSSL